MAKQLIGYYENPEPEDAEKIAREAKSYIDVVEAQEKGWIPIGVITKDTTEEELDELDDALCRAIAEAMVDEVLSKDEAGGLDEPVS